MLKLDWHEPKFISQRNFSIASDTSTANLYILRKKYNTEVTELNGILFRRYNGSNLNRNGYGFPLSDKNFDLKAAIELLKADSVLRGENLRFCLCDEEQRAEIDKIISVDWNSFDGDSEYVYKREDFARLAGRKLNNKRNLFNKFMRIYPDAQFFHITTDHLPDAFKIAQQWFAEKYKGEQSFQSKLESIRESCDNWKNLGLKGVIAYIGGEPAAMAFFSAVNTKCIVIYIVHAVPKFISSGIYPAIYRFIASTEENSTYEYINLEEDLGFLNLRRSKEAYYPLFKIKKYYGEVFN